MRKPPNEIPKIPLTYTQKPLARMRVVTSAHTMAPTWSTLEGNVCVQ